DVAFGPGTFCRQISLIDPEAQGRLGNLPGSPRAARRCLAQLLAVRIQVELGEPAILFAALRRGTGIEGLEAALLQLELIVADDFERRALPRADIEDAGDPALDPSTRSRLQRWWRATAGSL